jgi:hypothetical protein
MTIVIYPSLFPCSGDHEQATPGPQTIDKGEFKAIADTAC